MTALMPVPLAPPVMVIQLALETAVHEQLVPVTTERLPAVVPVAVTDALVAERLYEHCGAGAADAAGDAAATPPPRASAIETTSEKIGPDIHHPRAVMLEGTAAGAYPAPRLRYCNWLKAKELKS